MVLRNYITKIFNLTKKEGVMKYRISNNQILIEIPATNAGKFRFKKRKTELDFGEIFSTRDFSFDEQTYLEWQIGYDVPIKDIKDGKKITSLTSKHFVGSNGKTKYPYELSEIFYKAMELGFIIKKDVENLLNEIRNYNIFIDESDITVDPTSQININGISFEKTSIKLPTFFMIKTPDQTQIEVSIKNSNMLLAFNRWFIFAYL